MDGGRVFGTCDDMLALLDNPNNPLWVPTSSFHETMVNTDQEPQVRRPNPKRDRSDSAFGHGYEGEDTGGEESDPYPYNQSEKKRRLTAKQVEFLEKSFETENKLDPDRKEKLAKQLGLQSKQVAIWFQNRRARYKTKQIEKDYDTLKANYDSLKYDYDSLNEEKEKLQNEVEILKRQLVQKRIKQNNPNPKNTVHSIEEISTPETYGTVKKKGLGELVTLRNKQSEDASSGSAKSDVLNSDSPIRNDANQTSTSSTLVLGLDQQSDLSADDEEHFMMSENLLLPQTPPTFNNFLKVSDDENYDQSGSSCKFSLVDDQSFCSWLY